MVAKLTLLSLTQLQQLSQSEPTMDHHADPGSSHGSWVRNPNRVRSMEELDEDDESWEVRAFAKDYTGNVSGSTWPPRFYTCTFCKREFRSAQALGGHMNVHRRDRAATKRLDHHFPPPPASAMSPSTHQLANFNGGVCLLYQMPPQSNRVAPSDYNFVANHGSCSSPSQDYMSKIGTSSAQVGNFFDRGNNFDSNSNNEDIDAQDLDLELRLGHGP